jgi:dynein heavy chain
MLQELARYNRLLRVVVSSLKACISAVAGQIVMSESLEKVCKALVDGKIPEPWAAVSYPSARPLGGYVEDLVKRLAFLAHWVERGPPPVFWISGFFFTQAFLTGALQDFARRSSTPIDQVQFQFRVQTEAHEDISRPPPEGVYVHGLFIEGASWDPDAMALRDARPGILLEPAPVIWFRPVASASTEATASAAGAVNPASAPAPSSASASGPASASAPHGASAGLPPTFLYPCPVYRTAARRGVLSTTGHSTNFILEVDLPSNVDPTFWIRRGTCMLTG